jgi:hypothetical protein
MRPEDSPFPCGWWGTGLANVGLESVRPDVGTYGRYSFARLPPLPFPMHGTLDWLDRAPSHNHAIGNEKGREIAKAIVTLQEACGRIGLPLPPAFTKFMETPPLRDRIRSNTDCFLDLCPAPIRSPVGDGYLIRFLADSQGCIFWYLYVTRDGTDHAVVSTPGFYGTEDEGWQDEIPDASEIVLSAESFEPFLCRFWLENEIWFAEYENAPMPDVGAAYIEEYRTKA